MCKKILENFQCSSKSKRKTFSVLQKVKYLKGRFYSETLFIRPWVSQSQEAIDEVVK